MADKGFLLIVFLVLLCAVHSVHAQLFSDHFTRDTDPAPLSPWLVAQSTNWTITGGVLQGGTNALQTYGYAYITNTWINYSVQGRIQFPVGVFGGGLGGRLNPVTGAHYAAWIYPEGSVGGSNLLKLVKFQNWTTYGYTNSSYVPMQEVGLAAVGTNFHTVKLTFQTNRITVFFDSDQMMSVTDVEPLPYLTGAISADMWTDQAGYLMSVDDVLVSECSPVANSDSFVAGSGAPLTVAAPGVLANDAAGSGPLTAVLSTAPAHGTLNLSANGSFTYTATNNYTGADSFTYQASDGVSNSSPATVAISVVTEVPLFSDTFSRANDPAPLSPPWAARSGNWSVTGGVLKGGTNPASSYGFAYLTNGWTNYSVQARIQLPAGAFGGGLGACLNPASGAHYAAWIYPEASPGGSNVLKLIKFQNWTTFGYHGSVGLSMQQVNLAAVGTNFHTLELAFQTNHLTVFFDSDQLISVTDGEALTYPSGSLSVDLWTETNGYAMSVDDVTVIKLGGDEVLGRPGPVVIQSITVAGGVATIAWGAVAGRAYRLQYEDSPIGANWSDVAPDVTATGATATATNSLGNASSRFYRVLLLP